MHTALQGHILAQKNGEFFAQPKLLSTLLNFIKLLVDFQLHMSALAPVRSHGFNPINFTSESSPLACSQSLPMLSTELLQSQSLSMFSIQLYQCSPSSAPFRAVPSLSMFWTRHSPSPQAQCLSMFWIRHSPSPQAQCLSMFWTRHSPSPQAQSLSMFWIRH